VVTARDVDAAKLIAGAKEELKKVEEIKAPTWSVFVKSGVSKERPPVQQDFWYIRAASLLRRIYIDGPVGTAKLRTYYGGRKRRGHRKARSRRGSGAILRKLMQQLEKAELIKKIDKGRVITNKGQKFLDRIAYQVSK
jgi:small subunit ribosomal protein S19e